MIAELALALTLAQQPSSLLDPGLDHGNRAGLLDASPFVCQPGDDMAVCVPVPDDDEV